LTDVRNGLGELGPADRLADIGIHRDHRVGAVRGEHGQRDGQVDCGADRDRGDEHPPAQTGPPAFEPAVDRHRAGCDQHWEEPGQVVRLAAGRHEHDGEHDPSPRQEPDVAQGAVAEESHETRNPDGREHRADE
jgi:hypothetical protein